MNPTSAATPGTPNLDALAELSARLREARKTRQWDEQTVAEKLRVPARIVKAMERADLAALGPLVYARGHYRSYLKLLDLPEVLLARVFAPGPIETPLLAVPGQVRRRNFGERLAWGMSTLLVTGLVGANIWHWIQRHGGEAPSLAGLELTVGAERRAAGPAALDAEFVGPPRWAAGQGLSEAPPPPARPVSQAPMVASMAPFSSSGAGPGGNSSLQTGHGLRLRLDGESWVEVRDSQGRRLEFSLLAPGTERSYPLGEGLSVRLGNAPAVQAIVAGEALALEAYTQANVASFRLDAQGRVQSP